MLPMSPQSLPLREMSHNPPEEYCWEDYHKEMEDNYPIRWFLYDTLPMWFRVHITMTLQHWWYWFRSNTYNRYHIIDLRSDVGVKYDWGYLCGDTIMLLACFNQLRIFVEKQDGLWFLQQPEPKWDDTISDLEKKSYEEDVAIYKEIKELYDWWVSGRQAEIGERELNECLYRLEGSGYSTSDRDDEMLIRLMRVRKHLWT